MLQESKTNNQDLEPYDLPNTNTPQPPIIEVPQDTTTISTQDVPPEVLMLDNVVPVQNTNKQVSPIREPTVDALSNGFQQCALSTSFNDVVSSINECIQQVDVSTVATLQYIVNIIPQLTAHQQRTDLSLYQQIELMKLLAQLNSAIGNKYVQFSINSTNIPQQNQNLPPIDVNMIPPPVRTRPQLVTYKFLHQFISDMAFNTVSATSSKLDQQAQKQLQRYNDYSVRIDHVQHRNSPLWTIFSLRSSDFFQRHHLRKNQCEYLMSRIAPEGNRVNQAMLDFPTFNPDFQFSWTIIFVTPSTLRCFERFTETDLASQSNLPINKDLSIHQIKARFAFQQGSRWIRIRLDYQLNADLNERDAFFISNGFTAYQATMADRKFSRVLFIRDKNTLAWDGEYIFTYADEEAAFMKTYLRWCNVSPLLQLGNFSVEILDANVLPQLPTDMPIPRYYEQLIPISSHWACTTKPQLQKHLRDKFCPSLGIGGVYLPRFADTKYAVTGKLIRAQPKFHSEISLENENQFFIWNIQEGKWIQTTTDISTCTQHQQYMQLQPKPLQEQQLEWESLRMYNTQQLDEFTNPEYGSMHFWMQYNRTQPSTQVLLSTSVLKPEFDSGFNPFKPLIQDDPIVKLIFSYQNPQSDPELQYRNYITNNSDIVPELAIRFRRLQSIGGFNQGHLYWKNRSIPGIFYKNRMPTPMEMLYIPLTHGTIMQLRQYCTTLSFIPKPLTSHVDEEKNQYYPHKKDCVKMYPYIQQLRSRTLQEQPQNLQPTPYTDTFQHDSLRRENLQKVPQSMDDILSFLETLPQAPHYQAVIDTDPNLPLMEWDVQYHCEQILHIRARTVARREKTQLYYDHRILVDISSPEAFADFILSVRPWFGCELYYNHTPITFPREYTTMPIQYGINYARVSTHWVHCPLLVGFFVSHPQPEKFYQPLGCPGCVLGPQFTPMNYYVYQTLYDTWTIIPQLLNDGSRQDHEYQRAKVRFLKMLIPKFPPLLDYKDQIDRQVVTSIVCPQQQRMYQQIGLKYKQRPQRQPTVVTSIRRRTNDNDQNTRRTRRTNYDNQNNSARTNIINQTVVQNTNE